MNVRRTHNWGSKRLFITGLSLVMLSSSCISSGLGVQKLKTKVLVRAMARDAKILSSHVGGALITIKDTETGKTLAQGVQKGGSGSTELIMKKPQERGAKIYDTKDAASYLAELELDKPTLVEITAEGPLAKPHAVQKASKTILLVPGHDIIGEGIVLELHGFIVDLLRKDSAALLKPDQPLELEASVTMLWGCPIEPGGLWDANRIEVVADVSWQDASYQKVRLTYAGKPNMFKGSVRTPSLEKATKPGLLNIQVIATDPKSANFGMDKATFKVAHP